MRVLRIAPFLITLLACRGGAESSADVTEHAGYRLAQSKEISLTGGTSTRLQVLEDKRIAPDLRRDFARGLPDDRCQEATDAKWRSFCDEIRRQPLKPAMVRLVDESGRELDTLLVERPVAEVIAIDSVPPRSLYGLAVDLTAEMGSYSGPYVRLLDSAARRLTWIKARDVVSGDIEEIRLVRTLKTDWQVAPRDDGSIDLLMVACRPNLDAKPSDDTSSFLITYSRYSIEGGEWRRHKRTTQGFWEDEGVFPLRSLFP